MATRTVLHDFGELGKLVEKHPLPWMINPRIEGRVIQDVRLLDRDDGPIFEGQIPEALARALIDGANAHVARREISERAEQLYREKSEMASELVKARQDAKHYQELSERLYQISLRDNACGHEQFAVSEYWRTRYEEQTLDIIRRGEVRARHDRIYRAMREVMMLGLNLDEVDGPIDMTPDEEKRLDVLREEFEAGKKAVVLNREAHAFQLARKAQQAAIKAGTAPNDHWELTYATASGTDNSDLKADDKDE